MIEFPHEPFAGALGLIVDEPKPSHAHFGPWKNKGEKYALIHVMSRPAGGEIRAYWREEGTTVLRLRYPAYPAEWPELDEAVRLLLGASEVLVGAEQ